MGQFVVRGQELPTTYVRAKFEDRSFFLGLFVFELEPMYATSETDRHAAVAKSRASIA